MCTNVNPVPRTLNQYCPHPAHSPASRDPSPASEIEIIKMKMEIYREVGPKGLNPFHRSFGNKMKEKLGQPLHHF